MLIAINLHVSPRPRKFRKLFLVTAGTTPTFGQKLRDVGTPLGIPGRTWPSSHMRKVGNGRRNGDAIAIVAECKVGNWLCFSYKGKKEQILLVIAVVLKSRVSLYLSKYTGIRE